MTIDVTQEDIAMARQYIKNNPANTPTYCPVALALKRKCKRGKVNVGNNFIHFYRDNKTKKYNLPAHAQAFISKFDANHEVAPFSFKVEA